MAHLFTLTPDIPAGAQKNRLRPFGGRKVRWTFLCFRLTSLKGEGVLRQVLANAVMAYDERLAARVRKALARRRMVTEKKMFGSIAFLWRGHMCCGVLNDDLVLRVGPDRYEEALAQPHARPMDFTGRAFKGFVYVGPGGCRTGKALAKWLARALDHVWALPAKRKRKTRKATTNA